MVYFDVSMQNSQVMKLFESKKDLGEDVPDIVFLKILSFPLVLENFLQQVSTITILHYDAIITRKATTEI